jgi:DNA-binding CsgD family transcriptional regulator
LEYIADITDSMNGEVAAASIMAFSGTEHASSGWVAPVTARSPSYETGSPVLHSGRTIRLDSFSKDYEIREDPTPETVVCPRLAADNFFGPLVIVSPDLKAVSCNVTASEVLSRADRISIRPDGRFSVYPNALDTKLKKIVRALVLEPNVRIADRSVLVCGRSGRPSHVVVASPLVSDEGDVTHVLLTIVEFEASEGKVCNSVLDAFGLTEREREFVEHFIQGCSVDEAARLMGISKNTGRVHLRNVVVKTGARNQVDLLRRIMKFPAMVGTARFHAI